MKENSVRHRTDLMVLVMVGLFILTILLVFWGPAVIAANWRSLSLATVVRPNPAFRDWPLGSTAMVAVEVVDVEDMYAVQLDLRFDPAKVQVVDADSGRVGTQVALGPILSSSDWSVVQNIVDNSVGTITLVATCVNASISFTGTGTLATVTFLGVDTGSSTFEFREVILVNRAQGSIPLTTNNGTLLVTDGQTLTPTHTAIPSPTPTATPTGTRTPTATPSAAIVAIVPSYRQMQLGQTTTVDIRILNVRNLYGADVLLSFDPTIVQIEDMNPSLPDAQITLGGFPYPDYPPVNAGDNVSGTLHCAVTQASPRPPANGEGTMGIITFRGIKRGVSPVRFTFVQLSDPEGIEIPSTTFDGEVEVLDVGAIAGRVSFQGRSTPPATDWVCPISVTLTISGQAVPTYTFAVTTDASGMFTLTNIMTGTYDIKVRDLHSLWNVRQGYSVAPGMNTVNMGTLVEGDADLNGTINILDFSILSTVYGTCAPNPVFDPRADFNNSMCVDIMDFSLLATNYGRSGEVLITGP